MARRNIFVQRELSRIEFRSRASFGVINARFKGFAGLAEALGVAEEAARKATFESVSRTSLRVQKAIRGEVGRIFRRNRRAANAVRRLVFDNEARGSAAIIFSKFGRRDGGEFVDFLAPYITGEDIMPRNARFLAVPLQRGRRNRDVSRFKNLEPFEHDGQVFLIRRRGARTTFMFLLLPRVRITKRLHPVRTARQEAGQMDARAKRSFRYVQPASARSGR